MSAHSSTVVTAAMIKPRLQASVARIRKERKQLLDIDHEVLAKRIEEGRARIMRGWWRRFMAWVGKPVSEPTDSECDSAVHEVHSWKYDEFWTDRHRREKLNKRLAELRYDEDALVNAILLCASSATQEITVNSTFMRIVETWEHSR